MATKIHMEALSPTMEEGQLVRWLKAEGDAVEAGDVLAEIETDKAVMELVARGPGILRRILLSEGDTAEVGSVIGVIADADEDVSGIVGADGDGDATAAGADRPDATGAPDGEEPKDEVGRKDADAADRRTEVPGSGRVKASPLAKRMAAELGIELSAVRGSGPGGRVVKSDVEAASRLGAAAPPAVSTLVAAPDAPEYVEVPVSQLRKTIARRLSESIGPVPTFYLTTVVDATRLLEARRAINEMLGDEGPKASVNDIVLKAAASALARRPECNAHWLGSGIRMFNRVHLGVAVALEDGLITPVIRNADLKGVGEIAAEVRELAGRARTKRLLPEEYTGATFSVSNLGMFGIHEFTAIINPPEAGILAVGRIEDTPVANDGEVAIRPRMRVTMSCDHRVIDGALGARFLATFKGMLEEPARMLT